MRFCSPIAHFTLRFTQPDPTNLASIREALLARVRGSGEGGSRGRRWLQGPPPAAVSGASAPPVPEAFLAPRVAVYQKILEGLGPRQRILYHSALDHHPKNLPLTEAALDTSFFAGIACGDEAAFGAFFDRYAGRLNGQARRALGDAEGTAAVKATFDLLLDQAAALVQRGEAAPSGFLFCTLRYQIVYALAARVTPREDGGLSPPLSDDATLGALLRPREEPRVAHHLERACNPLEQEVMMLDVEGRSDDAIAAELALPAAQVRVVRGRARDELRREMGAGGR